VFLNHGPQRIVYHPNVDVDVAGSKFWPVLLRVVPGLEIRKTSRPSHVFGQRLTSVQVSGS
jgi:hypothetical protein